MQPTYFYNRYSDQYNPAMRENNLVRVNEGISFANSEEAETEARIDIKNNNLNNYK